MEGGLSLMMLQTMLQTMNHRRSFFFENRVFTDPPLKSIKTCEFDTFLITSNPIFDLHTLQQ